MTTKQTNPNSDRELQGLSSPFPAPPSPALRRPFVKFAKEIGSGSVRVAQAAALPPASFPRWGPHRAAAASFSAAHTGHRPRRRAPASDPSFGPVPGSNVNSVPESSARERKFHTPGEWALGSWGCWAEAPWKGQGRRPRRSKLGPGCCCGVLGFGWMQSGWVLAPQEGGRGQGLWLWEVTWGRCSRRFWGFVRP